MVGHCNQLTIYSLELPHEVEVKGGESDRPALVDHPEHHHHAGLLALQLHSGPPMVVQFKHIRWNPLDPDEEVKQP